MSWILTFTRHRDFFYKSDCLSCCFHQCLHPLVKDHSRALNDTMVNDVREYLWMNGVVKCHFNIYEWMRKFICYFKNSAFIYANFKSIYSDFMIKMICKKKKLPLVNGADGNFRLSEPRYCVNSPPRGQKRPLLHLHRLISKYWYKPYRM